MARLITHIIHDDGTHEVTAYHDSTAQISIERDDMQVFDPSPQKRSITITGYVAATLGTAATLDEGMARVISGLADQLRETRQRADRAETREAIAKRETRREIIEKLMDDHEQRYNDLI